MAASDQDQGIQSQPWRLLEEALALSRRDYWELFEASLDAVLVTNPEGETILDANRAASELYGLGHHELVGRSWESLGTSAASADSLVARTLVEGGLRDRRAIHRHRDGRPLALEISTTTVTYGGHAVVLSLHRDVTERLRHEAERERLIRLLHASATIANALHANPDPTQAATQALEILGTVANATRCAWLEITHRDGEAVHFAVAAEWCAPGIASVTPRFFTRWLPSMLGPGAARRLRRGETVLLRVCDLQQEARQVLEALGSQSVLLVPLIVGPEPVGYLCLDSSDPAREWFHEEYHLLEAVGESFAIALERWREKARGERLAVLVEQATEGVLLVDEERCVSYVNAAFCELTGLTPAEVIGQPADLILLALGGAHEGGSQDWAGALRGEWRGRLRLGTTPGTAQWVDVTAFPLRDGSGAIAGHACLLADITEQSRLEVMLLQAQKMEALGKLAAGIAHDFNNINMVVLGTVERLQRRVPAGDATHEELTTIRRASKRAAELTRGLLAFARKQVLRKRRVDLAGVVGEMLPMLRRLVPESIRIEFDPGQESLVVDADVGQIEQVVVNLCVNARDAMPTGGMLRLRTTRRLLDADYLSVRPWAPKGWYARLEVRDTGCGMTAETMSHILEPFFTTKGPERGTGLGLASVYGIIKQHGGVLDFSSEVGAGSTFEVYLPLQSGAAGTVREASGPRAPVRGSERILLVEDQADLRQLECSVLTELGYTVTAAGDGAEALQIVEREPTGFDLVVTDLVMPGVGGVDLFRRLAESGSRIPFLFVSGYPEEAAGEDLPRGPNAAYLSKPCSIEELAAKIRELLQAARAAIFALAAENR